MKEVLQLTTDGKRSRLILLGHDITQCTEKVVIEARPLEVAISLTLFNLDKATPND